MKGRKLASLLLAGAATTAMLTGPAQAAEVPSPQELAAARLQSEGLMKGDENGELHLEDGLTRAELACLISPIVLNPEHVAWETDWYTRMCTTNFNDVPEWAQVAVGVCASMGTMEGYGDGRFGTSDPVSPQMACTVMLRYLERDGWTYDTCPSRSAGRRRHHPWGYGHPAGRLPGLPGIPANPVRKYCVFPKRPPVCVAPGAVILRLRRKFRP